MSSKGKINKKVLALPHFAVVYYSGITDGPLGGIAAKQRAERPPTNVLRGEEEYEE
jgi:hypothetical protein